MTHDSGFFVYIMASSNGVALYVGSTNDPARRIAEHKGQFVESHTKDYQIHKLVYYEVHADLENALIREKRIKRWRREWKQKLITDFNPRWEDLSSSLV